MPDRRARPRRRGRRLELGDAAGRSSSARVSAPAGRGRAAISRTRCSRPASRALSELAAGVETRDQVRDPEHGENHGAAGHAGAERQPGNIRRQPGRAAARKWNWRRTWSLLGGQGRCAPALHARRRLRRDRRIGAGRRWRRRGGGRRRRFRCRYRLAFDLGRGEVDRRRPAAASAQLRRHTGGGGWFVRHIGSLPGPGCRFAERTNILKRIGDRVVTNCRRPGLWCATCSNRGFTSPRGRSAPLQPARARPLFRRRRPRKAAPRPGGRGNSAGASAPPRERRRRRAQSR